MHMLETGYRRWDEAVYLISNACTVAEVCYYVGGSCGGGIPRFICE